MYYVASCTAVCARGVHYVNRVHALSRLRQGRIANRSTSPSGLLKPMSEQCPATQRRSDHRLNSGLPDRHPGRALHRVRPAAAPYDSRFAEPVVDAMIATIKNLPAVLRRTVNCDLGHELAQPRASAVRAASTCTSATFSHLGSAAATRHQRMLRQGFPIARPIRALPAQLDNVVSNQRRPHDRLPRPAYMLGQLLSPPTETTVTPTLHHTLASLSPTRV